MHFDEELAELLREGLTSGVAAAIVALANRESIGVTLSISGRIAWSSPGAPTTRTEECMASLRLSSESPKEDTGSVAQPANELRLRRESRATTSRGTTYYLSRWWLTTFGELDFIACSITDIPLVDSQYDAAAKLAALFDDVFAYTIESRNLFVNVYHEVSHQLLPLISDIRSIRRLLGANCAQDVAKVVRRLDSGAQMAAFSCENIVRYLSHPGSSMHRRQLAKPHLQRLSLSQLVAEAAEQFRSLAEARGIELRFDGASVEEVMVRGDSFHLRRMLYNVLNNAVKYSYKSSGAPQSLTLRYIDLEIVPRYSVEKREAAVVVQNYGVGLEPGEEQVIMKPGYRGARARREGIRGCGVGLGQVAEIARMHGGRVKVRARPVGAESDAPSLFTVQIILPTILLH